METKICSKCKEEKSVKEFHKNKNTKDGLNYWCKDCYREWSEQNKQHVKEYKKEWAEQNKQHIKEHRQEYRKNNLEKLKEKDKLYYQTNRDKILETSKIYRDKNRDIINERNKKYYQKNKLKISEWHKKYYQENKDYLLEKSSEYRQNNQNKIIKYRNENRDKQRHRNKEYYNKNKKKLNEKRQARLINDVNFKLSKRLRDRIYRAIKINKPGSAVKDLGCSLEYLKDYLEQQFKDDMNWENYGDVWSIDHIIPLSAFNLENRLQFRAACYYKNLQPLYCKDNLKKNNKYNKRDFENYMKQFEVLDD